MPGLAPDDVHERAHRLADRRLAVDREDLVAGLEAGRLGRRTLERRDDDHRARLGHDRARLEVRGVDEVLHPDLGADAAELAGQVLERLAVLLGRQVAGVRVLEPVLDHPAHGAVDELLVGDLVDVAAADLRVRVAQDGERLARLGAGDRLEHRRRPGRGGVGRDDHGRLRGGGASAWANGPPEPPMARPAMKVMAPNRRSTPMSAAALASGDRRGVGVAVMVFLRVGRAAGAFSPESGTPAGRRIRRTERVTRARPAARGRSGSPRWRAHRRARPCPDGDRAAGRGSRASHRSRSRRRRRH